jgi:GH15 family glucan-1,4-alpha-glucosidase
VHIGNAASEQFQLDVFGETLDAVHLARRGGVPADTAGWDALRRFVEHVEAVWQEPDDGIWEVRGGRRHFTHSKVMAWVALDRAVRLIEEFSLGGSAARATELPRWRAQRDMIHREVLAHGFDAAVGAFTQSYGDPALDASVLLIPHMGFLPASDPRMLSTVRAIERTLMRDGLVRRYATESTHDGLSGDEGAFLPCSFWLADNYAFSGRVDDAERLFDRLAGLANDLGLLAEEFDPRVKRLVGNFPQAFSHVALVNTSYNIERARSARAASKREAAKPAPAPAPTARP